MSAIIRSQSHTAKTKIKSQMNEKKFSVLFKLPDD